MVRIALQLYTLRAQFESDPAQTIERIAALGFDGIELAQRPSMQAREFARLLRGYGLEACSAHVPIDVFDGPLDQELLWADALGYDTVVVPWVTPPSTASERDAMALRIARAAERAHNAGVGFAYHNHDFDVRAIDDGPSLLERLISLEPDLLLEPDAGWLWFAGLDPLEFLRTHADRCPLVHIKDFRDRDSHSFCPVGQGAVGLDRLIPELPELPVRWAIAEQDEFEPGSDPWQSVERSLEAIRSHLP
ncbi:MAG: sugar phosphate isomerase/epimerase [Phycisphaeraceae bacterium]|nr:sugar phosphate isomerase/epimerase [Phycisphaeraceae bacterium]